MRHIKFQNENNFKVLANNKNFIHFITKNCRIYSLGSIFRVFFITENLICKIYFSLNQEKYKIFQTFIRLNG